MIIQIILLIIGFVLLIKGADIFIDGASSTAQNFKISKMLIGLTIVAFGTGAPELAISLNAMAVGNTDMVLGNVIGSNTTNGLLILGVAAIIRTITVKQNTVKKELPLHALISAILVVLFLDKEINNLSPNMISRSDAIAILLMFSIFLYYIFSMSKNKIDKDEAPGKHSTLKSLLFVGLGLAYIILGSDLVVDSATNIATNLGISERVISLTIIAFGTSLPELVTTIISSIKKEQDILMGNIVGSNIFNMCIVLGLPVSIYGNVIPYSFQIIDLIALIVMAILIYILPKTNNYKITKSDGIILISIYILYYLAVFIF